MIEGVIFRGEGFGYILDGDFEEIYTIAEKKESRFGTEKLIPGERYTLNGFFSRPVQYVGVNKEHRDLSIWYLGKTATLFGFRHYFREIFIVTPTRIVVQFGPGHGRDFNYRGGVWK